MILGDKTLVRDRSNTYFVELRFISENYEICYDHSYFDFPGLLKLLPILTATDKVELSDAELVDFICERFCSFGDTRFYSLVNIAYVDNSSLFHYFDFNLAYIQQHHPELLL